MDGASSFTTLIITTVLLVKIEATSEITCSKTDSGNIPCPGQCYAKMKVTTDGPQFDQGCFHNDSLIGIGGSMLHFCGECEADEVIFCCNTSYCNAINASLYPLTAKTFEALFPCNTATVQSETNHSLPTDTNANFSTDITSFKSNSNMPLIVGLVVFPLCLALLPLAVLPCRRKKFRKNFRKWLVKAVVCLNEETPSNPDVLASSTVENQTSGSGSGHSRLMEKTIAHSICVKEAIGSGRYGRVHRGEYLQESVAVKKFVNVSEDIEISWARECELYTSVSLRHDNILVFITNDIVSRIDGGLTELWLVTQYHSLGSLYDYLKLEKLSLTTALKMTTSISKGLAYLHTSLPGVCKKPEIAHRDIKSRNILVKDNLECCLADFGLAIGWRSEVNFLVTAHQGTKRYMAPEILDGRIDITEMESLLCADVYSFGLVLWEVFSRCQLGDCCLEEYRLPFEGLVPADPSITDMYRVVVKEQKRPQFPSHWQENKTLQDLKFIMSECWYHDPNARPNMVGIKVKLLDLSA